MTFDIPSICIMTATLLAAAWLSGFWRVLMELSWTKISKLEEQGNDKQIGRAKRYLLERPRFHIIIRFLMLIDIGIMAVLLHMSLISQIPGIPPILMAILSGFGATVLFVIAGEMIGAALLSMRPWLVLDLSEVPLRICAVLLSPLLRPRMIVHRRIREMGDPDDNGDGVSIADEIVSLIEHDANMPESDATLDTAERRMIKGIIDLEDTKVREIMTPRVDIMALPVTATEAEVRKAIIESGHSRIPIYRGTIDDIIGMVYAKDLLDDARTDSDGGLESNLHPAIFIPETKDIDELLDELRQHKIHLAIAIDEYGGTAGVVSIEDILEEIVGEIIDEYDFDEVDEIPDTLASDGTVELDARCPIDKVNELFQLHISEREDFDTIGGYVTKEAGRIPATAEVITLDSLRCEIIEADERKIRKIKLERITTKNE